MRRAGLRGRRRVRGELIAGEHPGYARPPHRGPAVSDHRRRLHRGRRGRAPGRCLPRVLRPLAGRARQDPVDRRHRGPGGPGRGRRVHRRGPRPTCRRSAVGHVQRGRWPSPCWPRTRSATSATRWPSWSPRSRYQGEDAAELVDVDYDPLPAVVDLRRRAKPARCCSTRTRAPTSRRTSATPARWTSTCSTSCEVVATRTIMNQRVAPAPMETRAAAAVWGEDGRLTAVDTEPGRARAPRAAWPGCSASPTEKVRIITPDVGGAFGAKFGADPEHAVVAWVARRARPPGPVDRDPVREPDRDDPRPGAAADGHHRRQPGRHRAGLPAGGRAGLRRLRQDRRDAAVPDHPDDPGPSTQFPRAEAVAKSVVTTTTPLGAYRGAGRPEATAALERAMDLFAAEIGMDPADVRRRNLLPPFTEPHRTAFGALYDSGDYAAALDKALAAAGYDELRAEQAERREPRRRRSRSASAWRATSRSPAGRRRGHPAGGERHRRGPSRRDRDDPHRHLAARPGPRDRVGDAGQRGARHPGRQDHA